MGLACIKVYPEHSQQAEVLLSFCGQVQDIKWQDPFKVFYVETDSVPDGIHASTVTLDVKKHKYKTTVSISINRQQAVPKTTMSGT